MATTNDGAFEPWLASPEGILLQKAAGSSRLPVPGTALRLCLDLASDNFDDDNSDNGYFVEAIESDSHVTLRLLATANCLASKFNKWHSIAQLVDGETRNCLADYLWLIALSDALQTFPADNSSRDLSRHRDQIWRHSLLTGILTCHLQDRLGISRQLALASGAAHDIGHILLKAPGESYGALWHCEHEAQLNCGQPVAPELDHGRLGGTLLIWWNAPRALVESARHHHVPQRASDTNSILVHTVRLADLCTEYLEIPRPESPLDLAEDAAWESLIERTSWLEVPDINQLASESLPQALLVTERLIHALAK